MHKILLAEDNRLNQLVAVGILRRVGCDVEIVDTGVAAIEAWAASDFDAILMDIMMPIMDGYRATAEIRALEMAQGLRRTPIIGFSARAMEGDRETALFAGLDDYVTKPLREDQLVSTLGRWLGAGHPSR